ncbi:hypothetical protein DFP72DRAFT_1024314 [Ephemerocybe angulata]|uniref:Protein kinase domain-containing protein n=1 Tax=Ephemerocybe angulata TaxID=980116 RepID=A0A8H6H705_9AGAR|nr:hypothetical protein DFP72DRAFT_1024314 [Tulosesus angulatus]
MTDKIGVTRQARDTHLTKLTHDDHHKTKPDISILATGPSFERAETSDKESMGYQNVASVFDVELDRTKTQPVEQVVQLGTYCRQIFMQQPNRNFVRSLIVTECNVRLVHYDRSGTYTTPFHNIHDDPLTFIRLVLGLSSTDECVLGLDTTVQWTKDPVTGKKASGAIKSVGREGNPVEYRLNMDVKPFIRASISGRGTTCWNALYPVTKERVLIKDAWRTWSKRSEIDHLRPARGVNGVVQMLAFEGHCAESKDYRPDSCTHQRFHNRIKSRAVMEQYGLPIWHFQTRAQLVGAIKDVVQAQKSLLDKLVLHRDISIQNILLGPSSEPSLRGFIIDLDMAVNIDDPASRISADPRTGTRQYQSIAVLLSSKARIQPSPPHDHLNDIESFYYVLCHLVFWFKRPGVPVDHVTDVLKKWESAKEDNACSWKRAFICDVFPKSLVGDYWGKPVLQLMLNFHDFIQKIHRTKSNIREDAGNSAGQLAMIKETLWGHAAEHYAEVDGILQVALDALELEESANSTLKIPEDTGSLAAPSIGVKRDLEGGLIEESRKKWKRNRLTRHFEAENAILEGSEE